MATIRPVEMGWAKAHMQTTDDGIRYISSPEPLANYPRALFDRFDYWANLVPDQAAIADRRCDTGWRTVSYADLRENSLAVGEYLLAHGCTADRGLAILAPNSIDHALLALGAMRAGIPYAPITPAYALMSTDFEKLKHVLTLMNPAMIYVDDITPYSISLDSAAPADCLRLAIRGAQGGLSLSDALSQVPGSAVVEAAASVNLDTVVKLLFTSGSTGMPKAVINSQRMMCSNQEMIRHAYAYIKAEPPTLVDWLPWNHTAGGNHNFGLTLYNGGTLYIDDGKPTPALMSETVRNLREVAPTLYFNVPKGYELLVDAMADNTELREVFFSRLKMIQYAGAGLSDHVMNSLKQMAVQTVGEEITIITGYGATETAPFATSPVAPLEVSGHIGLPAPGLELKLVPHDVKTELRLRGPSITPGYWGEPDKTAEAFDEEGFYCIKDAVKLVDPDDISQGLVFDGRIAEDFKLSSGTWVNFGKLRSELVAAAAPLVREVVLTGHDRDFLGALLFLDAEAARRLEPQLTEMSESELAGHGLIRDRLQQVLMKLAAGATGSSTRICRAMILEEPASLETGEMTDKGSVNQMAVLSRRADLVEMLYRDPVDSRVIAIAILDA